MRPAATCAALLVAGLALAPRAGATSSAISVTVSSTAGFTQTLAPIPVTVAAAPENIDIHQQATTFNTYAPGSNTDAHSGVQVVQYAVGGMSFRELALLAGIPSESLVAPPAAAVVVGNGAINLTRDEVIGGFTNPCTMAFACTALPDTLPSFAFVEPDQSEDDFIVLRPLRSFADYNGDNEIQTSVGGGLPVTFNIQGRPLIVGPPGQSATTVPVGGSATFTAPTSVKFGVLEDPNTPLTYAWSFGDGNSATGPSPSDTYTSPGTYSVFVTVTDQQGNRGVSQQITVQVPAPPGSPRPPAFVPFPPPAPKPPTPTPTPKSVVTKPAPVTPASHAIVKTAPPVSPAPHPGPSTSTDAKLRLSSDDGGGSGSGGGSGNGQGQGSGSGSATGVAGGSGSSAVGVAVGGSKVAGNATAQSGQAATTLPAKRVSGLVGVLIDPSGGAASVSNAAASAASHAASAARALAGGGRSVGVSWVGWLLGGLAVVVVIGGRALAEFEPRSPYRRLRIR